MHQWFNQQLTFDFILLKLFSLVAVESYRISPEKDTFCWPFSMNSTFRIICSTTFYFNVYERKDFYLSCLSMVPQQQCNFTLYIFIDIPDELVNPKLVGHCMINAPYCGYIKCYISTKYYFFLLHFWNVEIKMENTY